MMTTAIASITKSYAVGGACDEMHQSVLRIYSTWLVMISKHVVG